MTSCESRDTRPVQVLESSVKGYAKESLETACMNTLAYGATPFILNISSILKS